MMEQAEMKSLWYSSPAEELGERFHINPELLQKLNPNARLDEARQQLMVPNVQRAYGQVHAAKVLVSKNARTVAAFADDGSLLAQYPATIGSVHDPLPVGNWVITEVRQNPWFNYNPALFWDPKPGDAKARIRPGPIILSESYGSGSPKSITAFTARRTRRPSGTRNLTDASG